MMRQSLVHEQWTETMRALAAVDDDPRVKELAEFCADVLQHCGDSRELTLFLNARAERAMDSA